MIRPLSRPILYVLAWISFVLGVIGAFLPILPTTPFMILSAYLFGKSSPRMHSWLTSLPYFGNAIIEWEKDKVIKPKAKVTAITMLWLLIGASIIFAPIHYGLKIMLGCIAVSVTIFILTRKSYAQDENVSLADNISHK
jgi:uncharacterized membrane protein YbaN (DUF454 family)